MSKEDIRTVCAICSLLIQATIMLHLLGVVHL